MSPEREPELTVEQRRLRGLRCAQGVAACHDPADASARIESCVVGVIGCDRVRCVFHDAEEETWWCEGSDVEVASSQGIVAEATRTGAPVHRIVDVSDERFHPELDDPGGVGRATVLAVPVMDAAGQVQAVLVLARDHSRWFTTADVEWLTAFATDLAAALALVEARVECDADIRARAGLAEYRTEAVSARGAAREGAVLRVIPTWLQTVYAVLLAVAMIGVVVGVFYDVDGYAEGTALVLVHPRRSVVVDRAGTVGEISAQPGQRVRRGQVLARLDDHGEAQEVALVRARLDSLLRRRLRAPNDASVAGALSQLQQELAVAEQRAERQAIRAPVDGVVGDVRAVAGQAVDAGAPLLTLLDADEAPRVIVFLPGDERGRLEPGQELTLDLRALGGEPLRAVLSEVGNEVIGPSEARRFLGSAQADVLDLEGPVVIATAPLETTHYVADGEDLELHDGMRALARVRVRRETVIESLMPQGWGE